MTIKNAKFKKKKVRCLNCRTKNSFLVSSDIVKAKNYCSSCGSVIDTGREIWKYQCKDCNYKFDKPNRNKCPKCGSKQIKLLSTGKNIVGEIGAFLFDGLL